MPRKLNKRRDDGRIAVQVYIGMDQNKKRQYKTVYGQTQKEADEKALQIKLQYKKGIDVTCESDTWEDWATRWKQLKQLEVSHNRYVTYTCNLKRYNHLSGVKLVKIKASDIQEVLLASAQEGRAYKTLKEIKSVAKQVFDLAIENRVLDFNPASAVKVPKVATETERRALTDEERKWVENTAHRAQPAAMIMLYSGLRRGELIPLTWSDIDLKAKTITVNKFVENINGKYLQKPYGKTHYARRTVHIPQKLVNYLSTLPRSSLLISTGASGGMLTDSGYRRLWDSYLTDLNIKYGDFDGIALKPKRKTTKKLKQAPKSKFDPDGVPFVIPRITAHWLRHSCATMLYMAGVDVLTAKEQLGHADIKTTLNIYTHLDGIYKQKSLSKLDAYLEEKDNPTPKQAVAK